MATAVKWLNAELRAQREETEHGMAKRVDALRLAFGTVIEEVKEEARRAAKWREEEMKEKEMREEETKKRFEVLERQCLRARDTILEVNGERENLERERDELRRALQKAGDVNARLTRRAVEGKVGAFESRKDTLQHQSRHQKKIEMQKTPPDLRGAKALAKTLEVELEQLRSSHAKFLEGLDSKRDEGLDKLLEKIDAVSQEIEIKATQVKLANATLIGDGRND